MALEIINNQPVAFGSDHNDKAFHCGCFGQNFCQLVETNDDTSFQFRINQDCLGDDVLLVVPIGGDPSPLNKCLSLSVQAQSICFNFNRDCADEFCTGAFEDPEEEAACKLDPCAFGFCEDPDYLDCLDCVSDGFTGVINPGAPSNTFQVSPTGLKTYIVKYTIHSYQQGTIQLVMGTGSGAVNIGNGTFYDVITTNGGILSFNAVNFKGCILIGSLEAREFTSGTDYFYFITDQNGEVIRQITTYSQEQVGLSILVSFNWNYLDISPGCYRIGIFDTCDPGTRVNLVDTFENFDKVSINCASFLEHDSVHYKASLPCTGDIATISKSVGVDPQLINGRMYRLKFTVLLSGVTPPQVRPFVGTTNGTFITASGTYTVFLTAAGIVGKGAWGFRNEQINSPVIGVATVNVSEMTLQLVEPDILSDCYELADIHDCSVLLTWWNKEDAFGFIYSTGFMHKMRVIAKLWQPNYKKDKKVFTLSDSSKEVLSSQIDKIQKFSIEQVPEYIHDALSVAIDHDSFLIGGDNYVATEDDYVPEWRKSSLLAPVTIEMSKNSQQLLKNDNCE